MSRLTPLLGLFVALLATCTLAVYNDTEWQVDIEPINTWLIRTADLKYKTANGESTGKYDYSKLPQISNGYLGHTVFSDSFYINNIFFGTADKTRLAKFIPGIVFRLMPKEKVNNHYTEMDMANGYFHECYETSVAKMGVRVFASQDYPQALIYLGYYERTVDSPTVYYIKRPVDNTQVSDDLKVDQYNESSELDRMVVRPRAAASAEPATNASTVYIYWQPLLIKSEEVQSTVKGTLYYFQWVVANTDEASAKWVAKKLIDSYTNPMAVFNSHKEKWIKNLRRSGQVDSISLSSTIRSLQKTFTAAFYTLASNLPFSPVTTTVQDGANVRSYAGLSAGSLAGTDSKKYQGRVSWQSDMWSFFPSALFYDREVTKNLLKYRIAQRAKAEALAAKYTANYWTPSTSTGVNNMRFATETALDGEELISSTICSDCPNWQLYQSGLVALSMRHFVSTASDKLDDINDLMVACKGYDVLKGIAQMFLNAMKEEKGVYHIPGATPPPTVENKPVQKVSDELLTNVLASKTLETVRYVACLLNDQNSIFASDEVAKKASSIFIPFDNNKRVHKLNANANSVSRNEAATPLMLSFPVLWDVPTDVLANDYQNYRQLFSSNDVSLDQLALLAIAACAANQREDANNFISRMLQADVHIKEPYKLFKDQYLTVSYTDQSEDTHEYLTGSSALLSTVLYGFVGLRVHLDRLEFRNPQLFYLTNASISQLQLNNIYIGSVRFSITLNAQTLTTEVTAGSVANWKVSQTGDSALKDFSSTMRFQLTNSTSLITVYTDRATSKNGCLKYLPPTTNTNNLYSTSGTQRAQSSGAVLLLVTAVLGVLVFH